MLQAVANIAPRGVYVCGNTTTKSGLTVRLLLPFPIITVQQCNLFRASLDLQK